MSDKAQNAQVREVVKDGRDVVEVAHRPADGRVVAIAATAKDVGEYVSRLRGGVRAVLPSVSGRRLAARVFSMLTSTRSK
jgi:hypothetical protein